MTGRDYRYILSTVSSASKHKRLRFLRPYASMDMNGAYQHGYSDAIKQVMDIIIEEMQKVDESTGSIQQIPDCIKGTNFKGSLKHITDCTGADIFNKDPMHVTTYNSEDSNK